VFFTIIIAYSFIIGKQNTIKLVIASYLSLFAADAIGNMANIFVFQSEPLITIFYGINVSQTLIIMKITLFVVFMVSFAVSGAFDITMKEERPTLEFFMTFYFGTLSAGIIVSTILVFSSGASFLSTGGATITVIEDMYASSYFVRFIALNSNLWFSLPVISFLTLSFIKHMDS
jgi:hypothetical protein